ncbi:DUF6625 family protein [Sinomicrobium sp. M5D2P9]
MLSPKINMIGIYYGSWPWYFDFFLKSCSYNSDVTFYIITDIKPPQKYPDNVMFIFMTLKEVEKIASEKLGFNVNLENPYKLCDFKPAYGFFFEDILFEYDFWGHIDIDLIFGRIRNFFSNDLLSQYDVFSVRNEYPSGFFMLYRNNDLVNKLFKRSKDYKRIFSSPEHFCFDECNFQHLPLMDGVDITDTNSTIESMMHVIKKAQEMNLIKAHFDFYVIEGMPGYIKWTNGVLSYRNEFEILLYHLIQAKSNHYFRAQRWRKIPNTFYVEKTNFFRFSRKSLTGYFMRLIDKFRVECHKEINHFLILLNKRIMWAFPYFHRRLVSEGSYFFGNKKINIKRENNLYYASFDDDEKEQLTPVFYSKYLFFCHNWYWLFEFRENMLIVREGNGQKVNYKLKENVDKTFNLDRFTPSNRI